MNTNNDFFDDKAFARLLRENYHVTAVPQGFSQQIMDSIKAQPMPAYQRGYRIFTIPLILAFMAILLLPWTWGYLSGLIGMIMPLFDLPVPGSSILLMFLGMVSIPLLWWIDWLIGQNHPNPEPI